MKTTLICIAIILASWAASRVIERWSAYREWVERAPVRRNKVMEPETFTPTGAGGNPRAFICCEGIGKHEPGCTNALAAQLAAEQRRLDWLMDKTDGVAEVYAMTGCRHTALSRIAIDDMLALTSQEMEANGFDETGLSPQSGYDRSGARADKETKVFNHERDCGLTNDAGTCECSQPKTGSKIDV